jgi:hypothetical protein
MFVATRIKEFSTLIPKMSQIALWLHTKYWKEKYHQNDWCNTQSIKMKDHGNTNATQETNMTHMLANKPNEREIVQQVRCKACKGIRVGFDLDSHGGCSQELFLSTRAQLRLTL